MRSATFPIIKFNENATFGTNFPGFTENFNIKFYFHSFEIKLCSYFETVNDANVVTVRNIRRRNGRNRNRNAIPSLRFAKRSPLLFTDDPFDDKDLASCSVPDVLHQLNFGPEHSPAARDPHMSGEQTPVARDKSHFTDPGTS